MKKTQTSKTNLKSILIAEIPGKIAHSRTNALMLEATANALADPERAIILYDGGDSKVASCARASAARWLNINGCAGKFNVAARAGRCYLWKA